MIELKYIFKNVALMVSGQKLKLIGKSSTAYKVGYGEFLP